MWSNDFLKKWYFTINKRLSKWRNYRIAENLTLRLKWPVRKLVKNTTEADWDIVWDDSISVDQDFNIFVEEENEPNN
ncbi:hypothetical protein [Metamycoplasma gateae]|uniref:Uncharacterized protein n=1 Tax=Metamycoplasma gateae TaxID=35769 RepID=A0ABZ2AK88_9BACT|nr:hypothetical protein V2E26_02595 [Metamycoplasma gateae]